MEPAALWLSRLLILPRTPPSNKYVCAQSDSKHQRWGEKHAEPAELREGAPYLEQRSWLGFSFFQAWAGFTGRTRHPIFPFPCLSASGLWVSIQRQQGLPWPSGECGACSKHTKLLSALCTLSGSCTCIQSILILQLF